MYETVSIGAILGTLGYGIKYCITQKESYTYEQHYFIYTDESNKRRENEKGIKKLIVYPEDIVCRCIERHGKNKIDIEKIFRDGHVEYETKTI